MSNSNKAKSKLLDASSQEPSPQQYNEATSFIRKMLHYPDPKEAAQIIAEQAGLEFDQRIHGELEQLKLKQQELDARFKFSKARLETLEEKLHNTRQFVKSARGLEDDEPALGFTSWDGYDQISIILISLSLIAALALGAANIYANLMASGEQVFIDQPWLAVMLSTLVPAGSTAIKFISNIFEYERSKKRYTHLIYVLCTISLLVWAVCFALNFNGASGSIDWDSLSDETSGKGTMLVGVQIIAEILIAAALFLAAEDIAHKYSPQLLRESLDYTCAHDALNAHIASHEELREIRGITHARRVELEAARSSFINEQIANYLAIRSRQNII